MFRILPLAVALLLSTTLQPVVAGRLCNRADLRSPCVASSDLRANLIVGGTTGEGRFRIRNDDSDTAVELRASTANVTNRFSNDENESNGLVKAWARINPDGTILACWRCNKDPAETRRTALGTYKVDFTPLATDITGRPRLCAVDRGEEDNFCSMSDDSTDASTVDVDVWGDQDNVPEDGAFAIMIF